MKKYLLVLLPLLFTLISNNVQGQRPIPPSPNAASLGIFGKIPVDYFTGIPSVSIPIYTVTSGSISVPISLAYHTDLLKPDQHPGWVGLGWNLSAGGAITRKQNSGVDEFKQSPDDPESQSDSTIHSYLDHYSAMNTALWYDTTFFYNHNAYTNPYDLDPDEFDFNFGNYSGCFYLDHNGVWQVRSTTPVQLKVSYTTMNNFSLQSIAGYVISGQSPVLIPRIFYSFTITTEDGTQYQFGNDPNAVEFSRPLPVNANEIPFNINQTSFLKDEIVADTWMLTKITSPVGDTVAFHYARDGINTIISTSTNLFEYTVYNAGVSEGGGSGGGIENLVYSIVNPVYLTEIDTKNVSLKFSASDSQQLDYAIVPTNLRSYARWDIPGNYGHEYDYPNNTWKKLDTIQLLIDQVPAKNFVFTYKDTVTSRLFLLGFQEQDVSGKTIPAYHFYYNPKQLPAYNTFETDRWGFYNSKRFTHLYPTHYDDFAYVGEYYTTRAPDSASLFAGVLDSLSYPTGGSTSFIYEPNTYSEINGRYPFQVTTTVADSIAGGLRIHYIKNYTASGQFANEKEYLYQQSGSTRSSGILAGPTIYLEAGTNVPLENLAFPGPGITVTYKYWYDFSIEPLSYNKGSHISYSRVIERDIDSVGNALNGYSVYTYSNFDNAAYQDRSAIAWVVGLPIQRLYDPYNSTEHVRGNLLSKTDYDSHNRMLKQSIMTYDSTENLNPNNVRAWSHQERVIGSNAPPSTPVVLDYRYTAYLEYTDKPYLLTKEEDTYSYNPSTVVRDTTTYYYDNPVHGQLTRTVTSKSTGQVITSVNTYAQDYSSGTGFIDDMVTNHLIGVPIEQVTYQNDNNGTKILQGKITEYQAGGKGLASTAYQWENSPVLLAHFKFSDRAIGQLPYGTSAAGYQRDSSYVAKMTFNGYDAAGNIRSMTRVGSVPISYLWAYNRTYPIAEVKNADTTEFYYQGFEESTGSGIIGTAAHTGTKSSTSTTVSWTIPDSRNYVISYWYESGGVWKLHPETAYTGSSFTLTGGTAYDDIRIHPADAQMTTYTYAPMIGMTSSTDVKNETIYYEYDTFFRLINIKDEYGNIIKHITYHYQGQ